jgi:hypothetical protein
MYLGGGADVDAIRALRQIKGLNKLEISGYFATELPVYLEKTAGLKV